VDYSSSDTSALPGNKPADGLLVEVKGTLDAAGGEMNATKIELEDELGEGDTDEIEVMGFVTEIISDIDIIKFKIGNQEVHVDPDPEITVFVDGDSVDIVPGKKLEAEGSLADGILFAREIEFWEPDQIEVEGFVTDIVSVTEFTVEDQGQVVQVQTDAKTVFEPEDLNIVEGIKLEVKGVPLDIDHSVLIADKVSLEEG
jgi:hypothetical protein